MQQEFKKALQEKLNNKDLKQVTKAIEAVEEYLPKDPWSPWPKELRRKETAIGFKMIAWDGNIGASVDFNYKLELVMARFSKKVSSRLTFREWVFETINNKNHLDWLKEPITFNVDRMRKQAEGFLWFTKTIDFDEVAVSSQDVLKMLHTAKKLRSKEVKLYRKSTMATYRGPNAMMLSFEVANGVYVHIIGNTIDR